MELGTVLFGDDLEALRGHVVDPHHASRGGVPEGKGITMGLLTEYRSIRCLNYVKFIDNTDNDFPPELNGII